MRVRTRVMQATSRRLQEGIAKRPRILYVALRSEITRWNRDWLAAVQDNVTGSGGDMSLAVRTGMLRRGLGYRVTGASLADLKSRAVLAGVIYGKQREFGGVIRPTGGRRYLTIPISGNLTAAGVSRYSSAAQFRQDHPGETYVLRTRIGALLIMWRRPTAAAQRSAYASGKAKRLPDAGFIGPQTAAKAVKPVALWRLVREVDQPGPKSVAYPGPSKLGFFRSWNGRIDDRARGLQRIARLLVKGSDGVYG